MKKLSRAGLVRFALSAFVLFNLVWMRSLQSQPDLDERLPAPGSMINLGKHSLHLQCSGVGSPTVILEAGNSAWSTHWSLVQATLGHHTRVCSYDRAGMGWSEPGPLPRDADVVVHELGQLLKNSGEAPPYLMVGWSFGGPVVWLFSQRNPLLVAGVVMVDSPSGSFISWMHSEEASREHGQMMVGGAVTVLAGSSLSYAAFPAAARIVLTDVEFRERMKSTARIERATDEQIQSMRHLGTIPVTVIEAGKSPFAGRQWHESQTEFLALTDNGKLIVAEDIGHAVPVEGSEYIVDAILAMIEAGR